MHDPEPDAVRKYYAVYEVLVKEYTCFASTNGKLVWVMVQQPD
jgi:hypothetical protein